MNTPTIIRKEPALTRTSRRNLRKSPSIRAAVPAKAGRQDVEACEWELRLRRRVRTAFCWLVGILGYLPILWYGTQPVMYASELLKLSGLVLSACSVFGLVGWVVIRSVLGLARRIRMRIPIAGRKDVGRRIRTFALVSIVLAVIAVGLLFPQLESWIVSTVQTVFGFVAVVWLLRSGLLRYFPVGPSEEIDGTTGSWGPTALDGPGTGSGAYYYPSC